MHLYTAHITTTLFPSYTHVFCHLFTRTSSQGWAGKLSQTHQPKTSMGNTEWPQLQKLKEEKKQKGSRKLCKVSQECVGIPKTLVALFFPVLKSTRLGCMAHWYTACPALIGSWLPASTLHKPDVAGMCLSFSTLETDRSIRSSWSSLHYIANLRQGRTTWDLIFKKKIQFCV